MVRDVQQVNIYEKTTKGRRPPIKWTAYEVLLYGTYTTKSAVWRYGVVLYGIFTIAAWQYEMFDDRQLYANVEDLVV